LVERLPTDGSSCPNRWTHMQVGAILHPFEASVAVA
jgi:hypothetical protein